MQLLRVCKRTSSRILPGIQGRVREIIFSQTLMVHERRRGWEPFDIRSPGPADPATGHRPVRRIEAKGRARGQPVHLGTNQWLKARQLRDTYWLSVVWNPLEAAPETEAVRIQDPAHRLEYAAREVCTHSGYDTPAEALERAISDDAT
jgi:hypothetical protein